MKIIYLVVGYLIFLGLIGFTSCDIIKKKQFPSPPGYDFNKGKKLTLVNKLEEISGIAFVPGQDSLLMAINDEEGKIYRVNIKEPKQAFEPLKFAKAGDYEDIAFAGGKWLVLQSNGAIYLVDLEVNDGKKAEAVKILPKGEYEGMASVEDKLFVICKECPDNKDTEAAIYTISAANDSLVIEKIQMIDFGELIDGKNKKFLASALGKHPITGDWFILSHLKNSLVIADENFKVKLLIPLKRSQFAQPEGIAFAPNGDLFISSEGDENAGYIMRFNFQK